MKLYVVGLGPNGKEQMTLRAIKAIENSDCIVGYNLYVDLIKDLIKDKEIIQTGMMKEVDRCIAARDAALCGKTVCVVSSGDAGVYGMACLMFEVCENYDEIEIEVVSGVTAAQSGGALLGSPLTCDYAVVSLSDLLTPWEVIEKRIEGAAMGDFSIVLYNPASKKRVDHLQKACDIILKFKPKQTICAIVKNIGRQDEQFEIITLEKLRDTTVDMLTTVFIGNANTKIISGKMVTLRGYKIV